MKHSHFLKQFYTIDPDSGEYIIEISLKEYDDIFNTWDSSVYNIRDLDASLKSFLEECIYDIGANKKVTLRFNLKDEQKNPVMEKTIEKGVRNYFQYSLYTTKMRFSIRGRRTIIYILGSFLFTICSFYFKNILDNKIISQFLLTSLTVGGWIFLWEAFSLLFIQSSDFWRKKKQYKRILDSPIKFRYH